MSDLDVFVKDAEAVRDFLEHLDAGLADSDNQDWGRSTVRHLRAILADRDATLAALQAELRKPCNNITGISDEQRKWLEHVRYRLAVREASPSLAIPVAIIDALQAERDEYKDALDRSREGWRERINFAMEGPHTNDEECPSWYDGCNCGIVLRLQADIASLRAALTVREGEIEELRRELARACLCRADPIGTCLLTGDPLGAVIQTCRLHKDLIEQRDAARKEVTVREGEVAAWRQACGLIVMAADGEAPTDENPERLPVLVASRITREEKRAEAAEAENIELRAEIKRLHEHPFFWSRVERTPAGCWLWHGPQDPDGYGKVMHERRHWKAHRLSWFFHSGALPPKGMFVCHSCDTPSCVNPAHLWLGTNQENLADRNRKNRCAGTQRTHCPQGHEYTPENTRLSAQGRKRHCRECGRLRYAVS